LRQTYLSSPPHASIVKMMTAAKPYNHYQSFCNGANPSFEQWNQAVQNSISTLPPTLDDATWASILSDSMMAATETELLSKVSCRSPSRRMLIVLNALIDISTAVAFSPPAIASNLVREGPVPRFLMESMLKTLEAGPSEFVVDYQKDVFAVKVRELRQVTGTCWNDQTWEGLDDVLRMLRDFSGPVGFRKGCEAIERQLQTPSYPMKKRQQAENHIIHFIRNEISAMVYPSTCFQTKRNALNALADIGISLLEGHGKVGNIWRALTKALFKICKKSSKDELATMTRDIPSIPRVASSSFFEEFSGTGQEMVTILPTLIELNTFNSVSYSVFMEDMDGCPLDLSEPFANLLHTHLLAQQTRKKSQNDVRGLPLKLLYLRWTKRRHTYDDWDPCALQIILDQVFDRPLPLDGDRILKDFSGIFPIGQPINFRRFSPQTIADMRDIFSSTIAGIVKAKGIDASFDKKSDILLILTRMADQFCRCMRTSNIISSPHPYSNYFKDKQTEQQLTDCILHIWSSLEKGDLEKLRTSPLAVHMKSLANSRLPGMYPGLDEVMRILQDPPVENPVLSSRLRQQSHLEPSNKKKSISRFPAAKESINRNFTSDGIEIIDLID
jgi:hypothetical protein